MSGGIPVYFDCDTGIDDTLALFYLLSRPNHDLVGVGCVSGNVDAAQAARNTLDLLALAGRPDVPVAVGEHDFLTAPYTQGPAHIHGVNGVGDVTLATSGEPVEQDAADLLIALSHQYEGALEVIAVGPLTNLAVAVARDPELASRVARVTIMGGAALAPGNLSPAAEANIGHDPEAAAAVFDAGWPVTMVGLDVTMHHRMTDAERQQLVAAGTPLQTTLAEILDTYFGFYDGILGVRECTLHDPLAVAVATGDAVPSLAPVVKVKVETGSGPARGATVADLRGMYRGHPPVEGARHTVVLTIDRPFGPDMLEALLALKPAS
ncbi:nucleoside hydrolase [Herbiconiux sp. L3-i23]|uniref:nucleoside hydrolase n=1 Tax=Herbiconiux sp. L3-i23 TaxID=2905871 RepID=UPI00205E6610|nr:nucleoside hydrolase [Herbiconiux sp. L3-i23]BDI21430.1 inosine-uridine nucleoside N-ribohydrolase [Herbiconiux sp. L3-i23]